MRPIESELAELKMFCEKMEHRLISKSSFIRGTQCPKSLWLHLNQPDERDETSDARQQIFDTGHNVGFLAQQLFPGGIDASRGEHAQIAEAIPDSADAGSHTRKAIFIGGDAEDRCHSGNIQGIPMRESVSL